MVRSTTLATDAFMMPGSPSLVEGEASAVLKAAHHLRHQVGMAAWPYMSNYVCNIRASVYTTSLAYHRLALHCNIHTNTGFSKHNSLRYGIDVHHQLGITHLCTTMTSPPQWVQPGTTPHGIATRMMVALSWPGCTSSANGGVEPTS